MLFLSSISWGHAGARDTEIIEKASGQHAVVVTHDEDFRRIKQYRPLLIKHKVGYIYFRTPKKYVYWDYVKAFINKWEELKQAVMSADVPFAFEIDKKGNLRRNEF